MDNPIPTVALVDQACHRLLPSRYPPIDLYEDVATAHELEAVFEVEALTNPRLMEQTGDLSRVPKEDWLVGIPHGSYVMASVTHVNPEGGRFTTGDFGGYYCAPLLDTAIKETLYHQERLLGYTKEPPQRVQMRQLWARFSAQLTDLTGPDHLNSNLYHPTDYSHGQHFAAAQWTGGADGLRYRSVRHAGHDCYVIYRPRLFTEVCQAAHFDYCWNGSAITNVIKLSMY